MYGRPSFIGFLEDKCVLVCSSICQVGFSYIYFYKKKYSFFNENEVNYFECKRCKEQKERPYGSMTLKNNVLLQNPDSGHSKKCAPFSDIFITSFIQVYEEMENNNNNNNTPTKSAFRSNLLTCDSASYPVNSTSSSLNDKCVASLPSALSTFSPAPCSLAKDLKEYFQSHQLPAIYFKSEQDMKSIMASTNVSTTPSSLATKTSDWVCKSIKKKLENRVNSTSEQFFPKRTKISQDSNDLRSGHTSSAKSISFFEKIYNKDTLSKVSEFQRLISSNNEIKSSNDGKNKAFIIDSNHNHNPPEHIPTTNFGNLNTVQRSFLGEKFIKKELQDFASSRLNYFHKPPMSLPHPTSLPAVKPHKALMQSLMASSDSNLPSTAFSSSYPSTLAGASNQVNILSSSFPPNSLTPSISSPSPSSSSSVNNGDKSDSSTSQPSSTSANTKGLPKIAQINKLIAPVHIDVGGITYTTTLSSLTKYIFLFSKNGFVRHKYKGLGLKVASTKRFWYPESYLCKLFNGSVAIVLDSFKQNYFIDRDGIIFRHILNFMKNDELILPRDFCEFDLLLKESKFYNIKTLVQLIEKEIQEKSSSSKKECLVVTTSPDVGEVIYISGRKLTIKQIFPEIIDVLNENKKIAWNVNQNFVSSFPLNGYFNTFFVEVLERILSHKFSLISSHNAFEQCDKSCCKYLFSKDMRVNFKHSNLPNGLS